MLCSPLESLSLDFQKNLSYFFSHWKLKDFVLIYTKWLQTVPEKKGTLIYMWILPALFRLLWKVNWMQATFFTQREFPLKKAKAAGINSVYSCRIRFCLSRFVIYKLLALAFED